MMALDVKLLTDAARPEDLFGPLDGTPDEQTAAARRIYVAYAAEVHPDRGGDHDQFVHLDQLYQRALAAIADGRYGTATVDVTVTSKTATYRLLNQLDRGGLGALWDAETVAGVPVWIRHARRTGDNNLMGTEATALRKLAEDPTIDGAHQFFPTLIDKFRFRATGGMVRANVFAAEPGWVSLADVGVAYPNGIDPRDMAWMWRRVLTALSAAHSLGLVHGAPTPQHILLLPAQHGIRLIDWTGSATVGGKVPYAVPAWKYLYSPVTLNGGEASTGSDISTAARTMMWLCGGRDRLPRAFQAFFRGCTLDNTAPGLQPGDAGVLLGEFTDLIERMWGRRSFRPFTVPTNNRKVH